jgi:hypothetical protein
MKGVFFFKALYMKNLKHSKMEQNKKEEQEEDIMILTPVLENARKMLVAVLAIVAIYKLVPVICDTYLSGVAMKHGLWESNREG